MQRSLRDGLHSLDFAALVKSLEPRAASEDEKRRGEAVTAELKELAEFMQDMFKQSLFTQAGFSGHQYSLFMAEYDRQVKQYVVTEDLGDDQFEIMVEMPGEIVASNAESNAGSTARWKFDGGMVRDRELELLATSRVKR